MSGEGLDYSIVWGEVLLFTSVCARPFGHIPLFVTQRKRGSTLIL